MMMMIVSQQ